MRGGKLVVRGNVVGLDHHAAIADGLGDLLVQRLQGPEDIVGAIVAVGQRDPAGRGGSGGSRLRRGGRPGRGAGPFRRTGKAARKQRGGTGGESSLPKKVTTIGERGLFFRMVIHGAILQESGPGCQWRFWQWRIFWGGLFLIFILILLLIGPQKGDELKIMIRSKIKGGTKNVKSAAQSSAVEKMALLFREHLRLSRRPYK